MTIVYCAKDKREQVSPKIEQPFVFASPNDTNVDHTATKVVIVGNHPHIADRYKGIAQVSVLETEPETEDEEE